MTAAESQSGSSSGDPPRRPKRVRPAPAWLPKRLRAALHERRSRRIEREHLEAFRAFYDSLDGVEAPFYMFFTGGLLPWMSRAASFVPKEVDLVLIGSGLSEDEVRWVREHVDRPFHHVELRIDDKTATEFLFETQERNFGWVDVDCFVLEPQVFHDMARIDDDVAIQCAWSYRGAGDRDVVLTYLTFFNVDVIREVRERLGGSPSTYSFGISTGGRTSHYAFCRLPTRQQSEILARHLPLGEDGRRPVYVSEPDFYDTLQVYQVLAESLGYRVNKVRDLDSGARLYSDELVHVGKVSYYKRWKDHESPRDQMVYALLTQAEYVLLDAMPDLPQQYRESKAELESELRRLGLPTDVDTLRKILGQALGSRGAPPTALARILGDPEAAPNPPKAEAPAEA